jgi:hypothetical protein
MYAWQFAKANAIAKQRKLNTIYTLSNTKHFQPIQIILCYVIGDVNGKALFLYE